MARINGSVGANGDAYDYYIVYEETDIDISNNTSKVKAYAEIYCGDHSAWTGYSTTHTLIIDGQTFSNTLSTIDLSPGKYVKLVEAEKIIVHNSDGRKSIIISASSPTLPSGNGYGPVSGSASGTATLTTIPRTSSVSCADGNIGSSTTITINRASSSFTHTLEYNFGGLTGTIATKTSNTSIGWTIPTSFYAIIPNAMSGRGTITCKTYSGDTLIGASTCSFNAFVINSNPTIDGTIVDTNSTTIALTGNSSKLVKYYSNAQVKINATAKNSATITKRTVTAGNKSGSGTTVTLDNIETGSFKLSCADSRGLTASTTKNATLVNYIRLAFTSIVVERESSLSNTVKATIKGNYFNSSFGSVTNTITLKFKSKLANSSSWSTETILTPTLSGNTFFCEVTLGTNFPYTSNYQFEFIAQDRLMTVISTKSLTRGLPIIDIGENDVLVNGQIKNEELSSRYMAVSSNYVITPNVDITREWTSGNFGQIDINLNTPWNARYFDKVRWFKLRVFYIQNSNYQYPWQSIAVGRVLNGDVWAKRRSITSHGTITKMSDYNIYEDVFSYGTDQAQNGGLTFILEQIQCGCTIKYVEFFEVLPVLR